MEIDEAAAGGGVVGQGCDVTLAWSQGVSHSVCVCVCVCVCVAVSPE